MLETADYVASIGRYRIGSEKSGCISQQGRYLGPITAFFGIVIEPGSISEFSNAGWPDGQITGYRMVWL